MEPEKQRELEKRNETKPMHHIDALVERLLKDKDKIFPSDKLLKNRLQENVDVYKYLMTQYRAECVDDNVFRFVYRSFYGLNRWLTTPETQYKYFALFKKPETSLDLGGVLDELLDDKDKYYMSFATKLLHTKNPNLPIYDGNIASILKLHSKKSRPDCYIDIYNQLQQVHKELLEDKRIQSLITEFKEYYDAKSISNAKALDFMLWKSGEPTKNSFIRQQSTL